MQIIIFIKTLHSIKVICFGRNTYFELMKDQEIFVINCCDKYHEVDICGIKMNLRAVPYHICCYIQYF